MESSLIISKQAKGPVLSKAQKQFNNLIKKIEREREKLLAWKNLIPKYQQKYTTELYPLEQNLAKVRAELVRLFDKAHEAKGYSKIERLKMRDIICTIIDDVIDPNDENNLKEIYNKYNETSYEEDLEHDKNQIRTMFKEELGLDLGDDFDLASPEEVMAKIAMQIEGKYEQEEQLRAQ